jgi:hypothetical protein
MLTPIKYVPVATARVTQMPLRTFIVFEALSPALSRSGMECASLLRDPSIWAPRKQPVAYARLWPNSGREATASALPTFNQQNSNKPDSRANCCAGRNEEGWDEHCERAHDEAQFDDK